MAESLAADITLQRNSNQPSTGKAVMERQYLRESLGFYLQYVGSVEIVKDK